MTRTGSALLVLAVAAFGLGSAAAFAKPARCFTTDDGYYECDFRGTDKAGSFVIAANGYPTYSLVIDRPGFA
ncbi:MAG: hypothetical protein ABJK32_19540, partial [Nitratireductor sp.]